MAKPSKGSGRQTRKVPLDGYVPPKDPPNVMGTHMSPTPSMPDPQVKPVPRAPYRPVVEPPAANSPVAPLVP